MWEKKRALMVFKQLVKTWNTPNNLNSIDFYVIAGYGTIYFDSQLIHRKYNPLGVKWGKMNQKIKNTTTVFLQSITLYVLSFVCCCTFLLLSLQKYDCCSCMYFHTCILIVVIQCRNTIIVLLFGEKTSLLSVWDEHDWHWIYPPTGPVRL